MSKFVCLVVFPSYNGGIWEGALDLFDRVEYRFSTDPFTGEDLLTSAEAVEAGLAHAEAFGVPVERVKVEVCDSYEAFVQRTDLVAL